MLDIDFKPVFTRTVTVNIPSGASIIEQNFSASFEALDVPEFNGFDLSTPEGTKAFLERVLVDCDDIVDKGGNPVAFTAAMRDRLIAKTWARQGLIKAYLNGFQKEAEGN